MCDGNPKSRLQNATKRPARAGANKPLIACYFGGTEGLYQAIGRRWRDYEGKARSETLSLAEEVLRRIGGAVGQQHMDVGRLRQDPVCSAPARPTGRIAAPCGWRRKRRSPVTAGWPPCQIHPMPPPEPVHPHSPCAERDRSRAGDHGPAPLRCNAVVPARAGGGFSGVFPGSRAKGRSNKPWCFAAGADAEGVRHCRRWNRGAVAKLNAAYRCLTSSGCSACPKGEASHASQKRRRAPQITLHSRPDPCRGQGWGSSPGRRGRYAGSDDRTGRAGGR